MILRAAVYSFLFSLLVTFPATASEPTAADYLPNSTVIYAEVARPSELVTAIRNHPLGKTLRSLPEYPELTQKNVEFRKALTGLAIFEFVAKRNWCEAIDDTMSNGITLAVDGNTKGAVLLTHSPDEQRLNALRDRLLQAARDDATRKGKPEPFVEDDYRGHKFYRTDKSLLMGTFGQWLVATNNAELGREVVDRLLDGGSDELAEQQEFIAAREVAADNPAAWVYLDIKAIRAAGLAKEFYRDKSDNPGAELLIGGILSALKQAHTATVSAHLENDQVRLVLRVPHDSKAIPEEKEFYFGKQGQGVAPVALEPNRGLLTITSYRDVGEMWRRRADLFDENVNAQLAQGDANLSAVFAGMDFGSEVLAAFKPQVQIVSAAQNFDNRESRVPKIKLPAVAMLFQLKDPERMQRQLKVSFQSLIGLTNLGAGQNDLPQLELTTEKTEDGQLVSAMYEDFDRESEVSNGIIYNFSPSLGFVGDHFIIASTRELAEELMGLAKGGVESIPSQEKVVNTRMTIDNRVLREILEANRESLIAQNMLEKGHSRQAAEKEIGGLFSLLKLVSDTSVELATDDSGLELELVVGLAVDK